MKNDDRSVIERLDDIENKMPSWFKPRKRSEDIEETLGIPISDFIKTSTVYYVENDERKFRKSIKKCFIIPIVSISILVMILITLIVLFCFSRELEWLLLIACLFSCVVPVTLIVALSKQRNKKNANSLWNMTKTEFYITEKNNSQSIVEETNYTALYYIVRVFKIISIILSLILNSLYFILSLVLETISNELLFYLCYFLGFIIVFINILLLMSCRRHFYGGYSIVIENDKCCMYYPSLDIAKK